MNTHRRTAIATAWLMSAPTLALLAVFTLLPFAMALLLSLTDQRLVSPNAPRFVGLANYEALLGIRLIALAPDRAPDGAILRDERGGARYPSLRDLVRRDPAYHALRGMQEVTTLPFAERRLVVLARDLVFLKAIGNTLLFVLVAAPLQSALALLLALLVNQALPGITLFRAIYFMPVVISIVVVSMLWQFIYAADHGLLNALLARLSFGRFTGTNWLGDPRTALGAILAMSIWQGVGFHMVIWLSGLQTINPVLYEVAAIEGANRWQVFRFVTWPSLHETAVLILFVITIQAFSIFSQIKVMTGGGPLDSTQTIMFQAFQRGFLRQDTASGAAISVLFFALVSSASLLQRRLTRRRGRSCAV